MLGLYCEIQYLRGLSEHNLSRIGDRISVYRVLVGRSDGKTPLEKPKHRWEDNI
jgi:hypothetical protein